MGKKPKRLLILTILALLMQMTLFCGTVYGEGPTIDVEADKYYAFDGTDSGVTNKAYPNGDPTYEGDDTYGNMMAVGHDGPYGTEIVALKFNLPVFEKTVGKAILKIYIFEIPDSSKNPFITVSGSSKDDWAEDYNLADLPDTDVDLGAVATEVPITAIGWQEFDVTNFFADEAAEDGTATFVLTGLNSGDQSDVFTYDKAKAGFGAYLEITYANIAPVLAAIGDKTVDEGSELTFTAQGTDADANDLTYSLEGTVPAGASINALTGAFNWTPAEAQGPDSHTFTIRVTDNGTPSLSDSEDITVTVNEVNTAPVLAGIGNKTIDEGSELTFTASATDADLPANALTYSLEGAPAGAVINGTTGEFSWTPAEEALDDNTYTFTVKVTDNGTGSLTDEEEITVTVNKVNNAPVLDPIGNQTVNEGSELTFMVSSSAVDIPADTLTYGLEGNVPAGAAINAATGVFSWTPTEAQGPGSYTFTVKVTDDGTPSLSDSEEITVTVNEINTAPVLNAIGNKTVDEGSALTFTATATDEDVPANSFTYSLAGIVPDGASINAASGAFNWIPAEVQGPGSYTFTIKVTDSEGGSDSEVITVTVNEVNTAPVLPAIGNKTVDEGTELTFTVSATDADLPANALTYSLDGAPEEAAINGATGEFNWTPAEAQGGNDYTFTVKVMDSEGSSDSEEITVTVAKVNNAPVLAAIGNKTVNELSTLTFTVIGTDIDIPADTLTYSLEGAVPNGAAIDASLGEFSWTPTEAQGPGSYTFTVKVTDDGTPSLSDSEEITVTVNEVNTAPVLAAIGNKTVNEGTALTFTTSASDADLPSNTLTYSLVGAPDGAAINATTGVFSWTPSEDQGPDTYTFTVKVMDNGTPSLSDSENITVTVNEVNTAPVLAGIGNKTVDEGTELTFTASATDADDPANTLTYSLVGTVPDGASINSATGAFSWTPTEAQGGSNYTFKVKVTDNGAGNLTDEEEIIVTVAKVNNAPVLTAIGNKTVAELNLLTFTASASAVDIPADILTYSLVGAPAGASINSATGVFNWVPTEAQGPGSYTLTVKVTDSGSNSDSEQITVIVNEVNTTPVLAAIGNKTVNEGSELTFTASATDWDDPANTLTYDLEGNVPAGAAINSITGAFSWTPTEAQGPGTYTFTVKATDDGNPNLSDEEEITVTVNEVNTSPVLEAIGNKTVNELNSLPFTVSATDIDLPANTLTYSLEGAVPAGAVINAATGVFRWIPAEAQGGSDYTFTVKVADGGNPSLSDEEEITVTVNEVNMAPTLDPLTNLSLSSGAGLQTVNLTGISAGGNETQGIDVTASAGNMTLIPTITVSYTSPGTTGTLTFTPQGIGTAVVTVTVTDDGGTDNGGVNTTTRTFTVTVASHDRDSDDDDRSEGGRTDTSVVNTIITPVMDTDDDKDLNNNLAQQGAAVLNISGDADAKAALSSDVVNALSQAEMPLTIENQGIKVEFSPAALVVPALQDAQGVVEIGVREVTWAEKEDVLAAANLGESTGLFEIGGKMIELTAQVVTTTSDGAVVTNKVESFSEPVAVTIDLSGLNFTPEMIAELTGVRYEKDAAGNIVPIKLGGTFDPVTRCFTFYTDRFSYYSVLRADSLVQIHLTVDISAVTINGAGKILDVAPTIINSYTMVPVRFISEALGAAVEWQENTKTVVIKLDGQELSLVIGQTGPGLDVPAQIVSGRTMVPLSYVSKFLGAYVKWFPGERKVEIIK